MGDLGTAAVGGLSLGHGAGLAPLGLDDCVQDRLRLGGVLGVAIPLEERLALLAGGGVVLPDKGGVGLGEDMGGGGLEWRFGRRGPRRGSRILSASNRSAMRFRPCGAKSLRRRVEGIDPVNLSAQGASEDRSWGPMRLGLNVGREACL